MESMCDILHTKSIEYSIDEYSEIQAEQIL